MPPAPHATGQACALVLVDQLLSRVCAQAGHVAATVVADHGSILPGPVSVKSYGHG